MPGFLPCYCSTSPHRWLESRRNWRVARRSAAKSFFGAHIRNRFSSERISPYHCPSVGDPLRDVHRHNERCPANHPHQVAHWRLPLQSRARQAFSPSRNGSTSHELGGQADLAEMIVMIVSMKVLRLKHRRPSLLLSPSCADHAKFHSFRSTFYNSNSVGVISTIIILLSKVHNLWCP